MIDENLWNKIEIERVEGGFILAYFHPLEENEGELCYRRTKQVIEARDDDEWALSEALILGFHQVLDLLELRTTNESREKYSTEKYELVKYKRKTPEGDWEEVKRDGFTD